MKFAYYLVFIVIIQEFMCHEIADQILYELYPDILRTMSFTKVPDDIIVKNIEFIIPEIPFYKIEFFFDGRMNIKFSIRDINCYLNINVHPNPGDPNLYEHYKINLKNFWLRGDIEFVRDYSEPNRYKPYYKNWSISYDCDPINIDNTILFYEYVKEYYYTINNKVFKKFRDYWEGLINEIIQRLYLRGVIS